MPAVSQAPLAPAFRAPSNGAGPAWLAERRKKALAAFQRTGFPTPKLEEWRYTDVRGLAGIPFTEPGAAKFNAPGLAPLGVPELGTPRIVLANGAVDLRLTDVSKLPKGATFRPLSEALRTDEARRSRLADPQYETPFTQLNDAFWHDGVVVDVAKGVDAGALHIVHLADAPKGPIAVHPRVVLRLGPLSRATVVETFAARGTAPMLVNALSTAAVAEEARLDHVSLQAQPEGVHHVQQVDATLGRSAYYAHHNLTLGAALSRVEPNVRFDAEGGETLLNGLFLLRGAQHHDTHSRIDHAVPQCTSREFYKGILDGTSRGVFYGKVVVRKDAQKTNSSQTNKNLLLSDGALVDSTPALEINANDVKCSHGSTTGQLDATSVFYLRSRGLDEATARSLLTYAFARDIIGQVPLDALRAHLEAELASRLPHGSIVQEALHAR